MQTGVLVIIITILTIIIKLSFGEFVMDKHFSVFSGFVVIEGDKVLEAFNPSAKNLLFKFDSAIFPFFYCVTDGRRGCRVSHNLVGHDTLKDYVFNLRKRDRQYVADCINRIIEK